MHTLSGIKRLGSSDSPLRIACLVPSVTELLVALGLGPRLVARTSYCVHPNEALQWVPKVGGTKTVNLEKLRRLAPTHLIVNIDENRLEMVQAVRDWPEMQRPQIIVTHPCGPEDNRLLISRLVETFGADAGVRDLGAALRAELDVELARMRAVRWRAQRVLYLIWRDPWMTVARDTYVSRMLAQINWHSQPDCEGGTSGPGRYPQLCGDERWLADVQRVLLSSEPYAFGAADLDAAKGLCPSAHVQLVDGELLSWYGSRAVRGLRYLRTLGEPG